LKKAIRLYIHYIAPLLILSALIEVSLTPMITRLVEGLIT